MTDKTPPPAPESPDLGASMAGVVDAVLDVGVSLAKVMAQATAPGGVVQPLPPSTPAIQAIVRYGVTAVGNVASALISSGDVLRKAASSAGAPASAPRPARASGPRVRAGSTLRVPLSVENPGEHPMQQLAPRVREVRRASGIDASGIVDPASVRFEPAGFDVAPRDFEKLTVFVPVPEETPSGDYEVVIALGEDEPDLTIAFAVVAEED